LVGLWLPCLIPKLESDPFSAVHYCLFDVFSSVLHIWLRLIL